MEAPLLRSLGLTQQEIADALGVSQRTVSRWLEGLAKPLSEETAKASTFSQEYTYPFSHNGALVPRLLEGRYEEVAGEIEDGSIVSSSPTPPTWFPRTIFPGITRVTWCAPLASGMPSRCGDTGSPLSSGPVS